jgi:dTDP-4-amino-4,6-dideoxygalactose transaminase
VSEARALVHAAGAVLIEDAAQSLGACAGGMRVGVQGDFGLFSFGPGKPLSIGGGGLVCTGSGGYARALAGSWERLAAPTELAGRWALLRLGLYSLAFHPAGWWLASKAGAQKVGDNEASWGYALRGLAPSQAAVGLRLLPMLDAINHQRRTRASRWLAGLQGTPGLILPRAAQEGAIYLRLPLVAGSDRLPTGLAGQLQRRLAEAGIGVGRMYRRTLGEIFPELAAGPFPGAEQVARGLLTLPTNHYVTQDDIMLGVEIIRQSV